MPLRFERATGPNAEFIARSAGYSLDLARGEARLAIGGIKDGPRAAVTMRLFGASASANGEGRRVLPGITNYVIGNDPREWRTGVRSYAEVAYRGVYPGVDLVYYGNQRQLEFDFVVAPGASHRTIALAFDGSRGLSIDQSGNLLIETAAGTLVQHAPAIYQDKSGTRRTLRGGYVLRRDGRVGFNVHGHDRNLPLIIDPVLTYATYLGGSREERAEGLAFDAQGNMYVAGLTGAADFPGGDAPALRHGRDDWDVFVVKLNATGDQFLYATYIGGAGYEEPAGLAVDGEGNAYVTGQTDSRDFPLAGGMLSPRRGISDAFATKLDANGFVVYSTYLGGSGEDRGSGIAVDALGRAYVSGSTLSGDFPTTNALQPALGGYPAYRTTDGGHAWSGIAGGLRASSVRAFAIDPVDTQTVYAGTWSEGVFKSTDAGSTWAAISTELSTFPVNAMVVDSTGAVFAANDAGVFRSRDGGASWTMLQLWMPVSALVVDPISHVLYAGAPEWYPVGVFTSADGGETWNDTEFFGHVVTSLAVSHSVVYAGTSSGVFKKTGDGSWTDVSNGIQEAVMSVAVSADNPDVAYAGSNSALYQTVSGGSAWSARLTFPVWSVTIAASNPSIAYVATAYGSGMTEDGGILWQGSGPAGTNLAVFAIDPLDPRRVYGGGAVGWDSFVSRISADGSHLEYSTFIGGTSSEWGTDIAVDASGAAYVTGITQSTDFPIRGAFQPHGDGSMDVFVAKISDAGALVYSTYLGGTASDYAPKIAVDGSGQAHIVGITLSTNFPTANAFQPAHGGGWEDVFVTTLNASGNGLVYSTYFGGSDHDTSWKSPGPAIAVGPSGGAFITGATMSANFPTRDALQPTYSGGGSDAFVANFDPAGRLVYSTYLGGTGSDFGTHVAVDPSGAVAVAGGASSTDFWTRRAIQPANAGAQDVFITRIAPGTPPPDTTAPTSIVQTLGTLWPNGWFTSSVTVALRAVDDDEGSGVAFIDYSVNGGAWRRYSGPFSVAAQGTTTVRARATDRAGNAENPGVSSTFMIDSIAPAITLTSPSAQEYLHTASVQVSFTATDSLSGIAETFATLDGVAASNGQTISLLTLPLGVHIFNVTASDRAGNTSGTGTGFTVIATIDSLIGAVDSFVAAGQIDASAGRSLQSKLEAAKQALSRGNLTGARSKITDFRNQVSAQTGQSISPAAAQRLIADADYVIGTLQ
jgi:hypothetical protein